MFTIFKIIGVSPICVVEFTDIHTISWLFRRMRIDMLWETAGGMPSTQVLATR
jgi:hypothetical protein